MKFFGKNSRRKSGETERDQHEKILDALEWADTDSAETLEERKEELVRELEEARV